MLKLTPSLQAPAAYYAMRRYKKADFLIHVLFKLSANTSRILSGLVFDYLTNANDLSEFIYPTMTKTTNLLATGTIEEVVMSRAFKDLYTKGLIDIAKKRGWSVAFRITPLYFVLFDVCSCFDHSLDSYKFISKIREILDSNPQAPLTIEEVTLLFAPFFNSEEGSVFLGGTLLKELFASTMPPKSSNEKKLLKRS